MTKFPESDSILSKLMRLPRRHKKLIMLTADCLAIPFALWSAFALRFNELWPESYLYSAGILFLIAPVIGIAIFIKMGLYRAVVRHMGTQSIWMIGLAAVILSILLSFAALMLNIEPFPRSIPLIFAFVTLVYVGSSRLLLRTYYQWAMQTHDDQDAVLIYGAGESGTQLSKAIMDARELRCVGFVDEDHSLWNVSVSGQRVYSPDRLADVIQKKNVSTILLAIPSASQADRKRIIEQLLVYPVHVKTIPSLHELISGKSITAIRNVQVEDLLGRDPVVPQPQLLQKTIHHKVVMVTGAGGSIGSEICRQVMLLQPVALVLYEMSEFSLYTIHQELIQTLQENHLDVSLYPILGSVCDAERVSDVIKGFGVQTIYHAAAYKHVPLVEYNVFEGIRNNSLGTQVVAEAALSAGVERFILISTDKAVRPTNVMGATKRFAEIILQALAERSEHTIFAMVRFGNVLGSSGSVVPLFTQQILAGGPITVTHPDITRYFMTIPEASSLVIQAASMAQGGDVFVLDMGEPVRIADLADRMIRLMGYRRKDEHPTNGTIEIVYTGLRPGEKLYEELLIGDNVVGTDHPKIMRAMEEFISADELKDLLVSLQCAIDQKDCECALQLLEQAVSGFKPVSPVVDWLHTQQTALH